MNAAKYAQKLKHIRKVKAALKWREKTQKRLAPIKKENKETKEYILRQLQYQNDLTKADIKAARRNAKEDWELGPLRPHRAVGPRAKRYGAFEREQMREPSMPDHWFGAKESVQKRMKTKIPENVLKDQWPIVKEDRVVVIRGREKGKIGTVYEVLKDSNKVVVKDLNKVWVDGRLFGTAPGETAPDKREFEFSISYDDVRLLVPYDIYDVIDGREVKKRQDVIVDAIRMERHTKGVNPFTGEENDLAIPEEHQADPLTGEIIWHRYIAGTNYCIEWPWEESPQKRDDDARRKKTEDADSDDLELVSKTKREEAGVLDKIKSKVWGKDKGKPEQQPATTKSDQYLERIDPEKATSGAPLAHDPRDHEDDTSRNDVEITEADHEHFVPSLVYPPFYETVIEEIRGMYRNEKPKPDENEKVEEFQARRREELNAREQERQNRINSMKTPMQIKWELQQARKPRYDPSNPPKPSGDLLLALGKHMATKGRKLAGR